MREPFRCSRSRKGATVFVAKNKLVPQMQVVALEDGFSSTFNFKRSVEECPKGYRPHLESIQMIASAEVSTFIWGLADLEEKSPAGVVRRLPLDTQTDVTTYYDNGESDLGFPMLKSSAGWWVPYVQATLSGVTAEVLAQFAYYRLPCCKGCTEEQGK